MGACLSIPANHFSDVKMAGMEKQLADLSRLVVEKDRQLSQMAAASKGRPMPGGPPGTPSRFQTPMPQIPAVQSYGATPAMAGPGESEVLFFPGARRGPCCCCCCWLVRPLA